MKDQINNLTQKISVANYELFIHLHFENKTKKCRRKKKSMIFLSPFFFGCNSWYDLILYWFNKSMSIIK